MRIQRLLKHFEVTILILMMPVCICSQESITSDLKYEQHLNIAYSHLYILNTDIGDITFGDQGHPEKRQYILNGNIIPNFYITPRKWRVNAVISPIVKVRIIANQDSYPVRTPSFIPGIQLYFPYNRSSLQKYKYMSIGIFHHSNGQDGPALGTDGNPNLINGDFSTNFLSINHNWGKISNAKNFYHRAGIELHSGLIKFNDIPEYRNRFGKVRLNYHFGYERFAKFITRFKKNSVVIDSSSVEEEKYRIVASGMIVLDDIDAQWNQRFNLELKYYRKIHHSENTAWFISTGYMGHDNYNIYFYQPYPFIRLGFAASNAFMYNNRFKVQQKRITELSGFYRNPQ